MPLTPAEVHSVVFGKSPIGKRGYHEDEVDAFVDLVEAELTRLIADHDELCRQLEQHQGATPGESKSVLDSPVPSCPVVASLPPTPDQAVPEDDANARAARVLSLAQQMADRLTGEAQTEADAMVNQARVTAEQLLGDAQAKADDLVQDATTRTTDLLTDAHTRAEALERQSQEKTASLQRETARQHSETMAILNQEKNALENKIDRLHAFESDYRTRLKNYLAAQLHELDPDETVPPPAPVPHLQSLTTFSPNTHAETRSE
jgi:DivIVA domain-containing protein